MVTSDDESRFWSLIERLDWSKQGNDEAVLRPLRRQLARSSERQIADFFELLARALNALDTPEHYKAAGEPSGDCFLHGRLAVVANGYDTFARVLKSPAEFPKDAEFEELLYAADLAHAQRTGREFPRECSVNYESFTSEWWPHTREGWLH